MLKASLLSIQWRDLIQALMHVLVTGKNDEDPVKNECAIMVTSFFLNVQSIGIFPDASEAAYSAVLGRIWPKLILI